MVIVTMYFLISVVHAESWAYVTRESTVGVNWYIDKSDIYYKNGRLCFTTHAIYDNVNTNGYKSIFSEYEVESGKPARARVVAIAFVDSYGNIIDSAEDPESDQWVDIPPGTVGYELMTYAKKYAR